MKKVILSVIIAASAGSAMAQACTPDPIYADSLFGIWPDTTTNMAPGMVGIAYEQVLNMIIPSDAGLIDPQYAGVALDSIALDGLTGMPPGLSYACNSQTPAPCSYITGQLGCAIITGVPTTEGTYPLSIEVTAYTAFFGQVIPVPQTFGGYSIVIAQNTVGILEGSLIAAGSARAVPNPFTTNTNIEFQMSRSGQVQLSVFNLLGEKLWSKTVNGKSGLNKVPYENTDLQDGIYLFKVESGNDVFTGRMVVRH
ncbi:MAG: T9SS type A sorting domain-containing protein [Flavobacteriales bacterium]